MHKKSILLFIIFVGIFFILSKETRAACCEWNFKNVTRCRDIANDADGEKWCITPVGNMPVAGNFYRNGKCNLTSGSKNAEEGSCNRGFELQVPFPGSESIEKASNDPGLLAIAIVAIFQFGVWIAISFSIFMIMIAGFIWLTSAGNQTSISRAKGYITNAIVGLLIALFSYVILETINPQLVSLQMPGLAKPQDITTSSSCCFSWDEKKKMGETNFIKDPDTGKLQTCQDVGKGLGKQWDTCSVAIEKSGLTNGCCYCSKDKPTWTIKPIFTGDLSVKGDCYVKLPVIPRQEKQSKCEAKGSYCYIFYSEDCLDFIECFEKPQQF